MLNVKQKQEVLVQHLHVQEQVVHVQQEEEVELQDQVKDEKEVVHLYMKVRQEEVVEDQLQVKGEKEVEQLHMKEEEVVVQGLQEKEEEVQLEEVAMYCVVMTVLHVEQQQVNKHCSCQRKISWVVPIF